MKINRHILLGILLFVCVFSSRGMKGQDVNFAQYYANPLFLNPANAGGSQHIRAGLSYRNQWPNVPQAFTSFAASFDANLHAKNSGVGLTLFRDQAAEQAYELKKASLYYAYIMNLGEYSRLRIGIRAGLAQRSIDPSRYLFADQVIRQSSITNESLFFQSVYMDSGAGIMIHDDEHYWIGFTYDHLIPPDESLIDLAAPLRARQSLHAGYRWTLFDEFRGTDTEAIITIHYQQQATWDALDVGIYLQRGIALAGIWYRGMASLKENARGRPSHNAITLMFGAEFDELRVGYSYDIDATALVGRSGGAHELSLGYEIGRKTKYGKVRKVPTPRY